jgi:hypothetical protein
MSNKLKCVTTLPISPVFQPTLGLSSIPFIMDIFSKRLGMKSVLTLNVNGLKLSGQKRDDVALRYVSILNSIDIKPDNLWMDNYEENLSWVEIFFCQLLSKKHIIKERSPLIKCDCGAVECLQEAEAASPARTIFLVKEGKKYCKICKNEVKSSNETVYLFKFPSNFVFNGIFPAFYTREMEALAKKFQGRRFLISKSRPSALEIQVKGKKVTLDVDFVWQLFLPILNRYGHNPDILIGGSKNLMACCFSIIFYNFIDQKNISLIIPPYYLASNRKSLKGEEYSIENLLKKYDQKTLRLLLSSALNWQKKESVIDFLFGDFIQKISYRVFSNSKVTGLQEAINDFDGRKIKTLLSKFRKTKEKIHCGELYGLI